VPTAMGVTAGNPGETRDTPSGGSPRPEPTCVGLDPFHDVC
jgi:hypothetical protein